jgi:hypothetical protein
MKQLLFTLYLFFSLIEISAQEKPIEFYIGYNTSILKSIPEHFKYVDIGYQEKYGQGKFALSPFGFGMVTGLRLNFTGLPLSMDYAWIRKVTTSNIAFFPEYNQYGQYKMSYGNSSVGFIFGKHDKPVRFGINYDFGRVRLRKKRYERSEFRSGKWEDYVETMDLLLYRGKLYMGVNVYAICSWKFLEFRPYITFGTKEDYRNYTTYQDFPMQTTNMGLSVCVLPSRFKK